MTVAILAPKRRLREVERTFTSFLPLREADGVSVDKAARTARVVIITEGLGNLRDRNYYDSNSIDSCVKLFANGKQFFIDHPSESEERDRPERSIRDLAGYFFDTKRTSIPDPDTGEQLAACMASLRFDESASGQFALDKVATALEYQKRFPNSKDVYAGISINGGGVSHPGRIKGMDVNIVTQIQEVFSADIVTKPARGGRFLALMQEAARVAAWKRKTARESRMPTRMGGEKEAVMALKVKPTDKAALRESSRSALKKFKETLAAAVEASKAKKPIRAANRIKEAYAVLKEGVKTNEEEVKNLLTKMRAAINDGSDPLTIVKDIQADVGQLEKSIAPKKKVVPNGNGAAAADTAEGEKADEAAEGETAEGEAAEGETAEGEDAAEGETAEGETAEGEDAAEAATAEGEEADDDEPEGDGESEGYTDEDQDLGMGDDDLDDEMPPEDDQTGKEAAMQYKCASCGEVNQVMPPKGFTLTKMGESKKPETKEAQALRETVTRLRERNKDKEARFEKTHEKMQALMRENVQLRAENMAHRRLRVAKKLLKEANVPPDVLSPSDLIKHFEPPAWPFEIKRAVRTMETEKALLNGGGLPPRNGGAGKKGETADDAVITFRESYKKTTRKDDDEDEADEKQ